MNYNKINNLFGWVAFLIATVTYVLTLEPSTSFWDCGEFIACIYRLQVAHQPGAPLFTMLGKAFSLLSMGDNTKVAYWTNIGSALASSATILFLFWTITALAKKIITGKKNNEFLLSHDGKVIDTDLLKLTTTNIILIIGAGMVGALAYTFSDTFWFSAVESEVYAQSSLCTAIVFWAVLKWDAHADEEGANKWIVFIAYVMGLSIGIHLLNLLVIPAIALVVYFRKSSNITTKGTIYAFLTGVVIVALVLWGIIQYTVKGAAFADLFFVNTLGMGFGSGAIVFFLLVIAAIVAGIYFTVTNSKPAIIVAAVCFAAAVTISAGIIGAIIAAAILALLEYVVKIREKRFALNSFLVCTAFILFGYSSFVMIVIRAKAGTNLNNSDPQDAFALNGYLNRDQYGDTPLLYGNYYDSKPIEQTEGAKLYRRGEKKYEVAGTKLNTVYDRNTIFPRMFSQKPGHDEFYKSWTGIGNDQPTLGTNLSFFLTWQVSQMYTRYFLWNFAGRTNELDGQTSSDGPDGAWISGLNFKKTLPASVLESRSYNRLYCLPLIVGLLGIVFHFRRNQRDAGVVAVLFFFTGLAIVLYLNQDPLQPRERDYAYAGSFYAFAIWIGLGVLFIADFLSKKTDGKLAAIVSTGVCLVAVPVLMASQEWDDHNRSEKLTPHDMAYNYLNSCAPNAILFTYGDSDTYPLWYIQEVENVRPDVRIVNLSLLGTDWYIRQMKKKMNDSEPLPITMADDKFKTGIRDVLYYNDQKIAESIEVKDVFDFLVSDNRDVKAQMENGELTNFMPTKNLKITINPDEIIKNGVVPAAKKDQIVPVMEFKYPGNYVAKDNLALLDILAHNNWKRPVYFTVTMPNDNMMGLENYMFNEGFAYRLLPLKRDTTVNTLEADNTLQMYTNMMTKFKWGNMKNASYLDHESLTMFHPLITRLYLNMMDNLVKEGHPDLARNAVKKYMEVMPDITPSSESAIRKYYMAESSYRIGEKGAADKLLGQLNKFVTNTLDYNLVMVNDGKTDVKNNDIQLSMSLLNGLTALTADYNKPLNAQLTAKLKKYEQQFGVNTGGK